MKKLLQTITILLFFFPETYSQEFSRIFGEIGQAEISLSTYSRDPLAEAVILFDIGDARFVDVNEGYNIDFTRTKRIKILAREGVKYAEVSIPFYTDANGKKEVIKSIEAASYNYENGKMVKTLLDMNTVFDEKINNRWTAKKFVFPDVKQGTIVEFQYVLSTPFHFNLPDWEFQSRIPTVYSKYTVRMIPFYSYVFLLQGTSKFDYQSSTKDAVVRTFGQVSDVYGQSVGNGVKFQDLVHVYSMINVPAFRDESYITSVEDNLIKIDFQLAKIISPYGGTTEIMSTWPKLIKDILQDEAFGKFLNVSGRLASKTLPADLSLTGKTDMEKCRALVNYVKSAYKWDEFHSVNCSKSARDFINQKSGNSAEINLFLIALLKEAGFDAYPVLISTRNHGRINTSYPFLNLFNSVIAIVFVEGRPLLCDATEYFTQFDRIPPDCINEQGLIVKSGSEDWVKLNMGYKSIDAKSAKIEINPENLKMKVEVTMQAVEYDSYYYRKNYENDTVKLKEFFSGSGLSAVNKIQAFNFENNQRPYIVSCEGEADIEKLDDKMIVSPFLKFYPTVNRLTGSDRTYPVDFTYSNTESFVSTIKIPEGYKVLSLPEAYSMDNELAKINVSYTVTDGLINMDCSYGFKKAVYPPTDYRNIKSYFDVIVRKFNERIVLVKG
jgi:hypothetical protein